MTDCKSLEIIFPSEDDEYPSCAHGPTILFSVKNEKYFSCSFFRNKHNKCFFLDYKDLMKYKDKHGKVRSTKDMPEDSVDFESVKKTDLSQRIYCLTCKYFISDSKSYHKNHNLKIGITNEVLSSPSYFLKQLDCDKLNAQYFFDSHTLDFFGYVLNQLQIEKVVCIGAPRFNDYVKSRRKKSFLLDIDERYRAFNHTDNFASYNMCNNFYLCGEQQKLEKFLKDDDKESERCKICLFLDPPFGCRTELISTSIQQISELYRKTNSHLRLLTIFWIFPYYQEKYIKDVMPQMEMMDFEISYDNHKAFNREYKGRKEGSPIRAFTNVDLSLISYPKECQNDYKFCGICSKFVSVKNKHCKLCRICPSKNGATYKHCKKCHRCVKPNYQHCDKCQRCVQQANHSCA